MRLMTRLTCVHSERARRLPFIQSGEISGSGSVPSLPVSESTATARCWAALVEAAIAVPSTIKYHGSTVAGLRRGDCRRPLRAWRPLPSARRAAVSDAIKVSSPPATETAWSVAPFPPQSSL